MSSAKPVTPVPADDPPRWTAPWKLFVAVAAAFVALFALTVALPHDPYVRFQQLSKTIQFRAQWIYERIAFDRTPIDIAIVGNSRLGAGISGPQLQDALRDRLSVADGRALHVANLSMPQEGANMHYVIVKRLLADHPEVKLIVLSAIEQMPREGHPAFRNLADADDVLSAPKLINFDYANDLALLPFRQISLFVQSLAPQLFGDATRLDPLAYPGTDFDSTATIQLPDGKTIDRDTVPDPDALAASAAKARAGRTKALLPRSLAGYEFAGERYYTHKIVALARAHHVAVMFVQLPIFGDRTPVAETAFYRPLGPILRPSNIDGDYHLYSDYAHSNVNGTHVITAWLADQIARTRGLDAFAAAGQAH